MERAGLTGASSIRPAPERLQRMVSGIRLASTSTICRPIRRAPCVAVVLAPSPPGLRVRARPPG
eukprot:2188731-Pyramimonas_sp.AAC.1